MARKRMIDPSLWTDEGMADLTPRQQLLYIGLFSNADDDGRLKASLPAISLMLPTVYNGVDRSEIQGDLDSVCHTMRQLRRYESGGRPYMVFLNYRQWQKIDKPSPSVLPDPPDFETRSDSVREPFDEDSANPQEPFILNRIEEKGIEEKGDSGADAPPKAKRATQVPEDFTVTETLVKWGTDNGFTVRQMSAQVPEFIDHYRAKGEARKDWDRSFHNWMRRAKKWNHITPDGSMRVIEGSVFGGGYDPLRTISPEDKAEFERQMEKAKREQDAITERQWRAS